ncbi:MAG TPA: hypothetical protein VK458_22930, partial [Myxococcaceae bacterium]|nr:hypothetical protein [Myxococcaceae bacterium]
MPLFRPLGTLVVLALLGACTQHLPPDEPQPPGVADSGTSDSGTRTDGGTQTDGGTTDGGIALSFSLGNWNVEWFGDTTNGPTDEAKQLDNVQVVIANADLDFWGLQEIVDPTAF